MTLPTEIFPFIHTVQYKMFQEVCDYVRARRKIGLIYGDAGTGKSSGARNYVNSQPRMIGNNLSPVFYIELEQTEKTDRSFYNALVACIRRESPENVTAKVAGDEAKRLLIKYGYQCIIIDEFQFLQDSGLEAIRTMWDKTGIPMILITMSHFRRIIEKPKHLQLYSRISRVQEFDRLSARQIKQDLLPHIVSDDILNFDASQADADDIANTLFSLTRGNFREITKILEQAAELIQISIEANHRFDSSKRQQRPPPLLRLDTQTLQDAASMTMSPSAARS